MEARLFKSITASNKGPYSSFDFTPYLPRRDQPGKWLPGIERLEVCVVGWHCVNADNLIYWLDEQIYVVETTGNRIYEDGKYAAQRLRLVRKIETWNPRTQRMFACDCADRVLEIYERLHPGDHRPRQAIAVARRYAQGLAGDVELAAARSNAYHAVFCSDGWTQRKAAEAVLGVVEPNVARRGSLSTWWAARDAVWAANRKLIVDNWGRDNIIVDWHNTANSALDAETKWQTRRLWQYLEGKIQSPIP